MLATRPTLNGSDENEPEILAKLAEIDRELSDSQSLLGWERLRLAKIVLSVLTQIVKTIDTLARKDHVYYINIVINQEQIAVPIHLEEYKETSGPARKKQILDALPRMFISSYQTVKEHKHKDLKRRDEALKIFVSKLDGNCIDARTRAAFDYAAAIWSPPPFQTVIEKCQSKFDEAKNDSTYYSLFIELLTTRWDQPYSKDAATSSPCKKDGDFDLSCFELLAGYFNTCLMLNCNDEADFTKYLTQLNARNLPIFLHFVVYSCVTFKDAKNGIEAYNRLLVLFNKNRKLCDFNVLESLLAINHKLSGLQPELRAEEILDKKKEVMELTLAVINDALNRWFPIFWSQLEISQLCQFLMKEELRAYVKENRSDAVQGIMNSRSLVSLLRQVGKQEGLDPAILLTDALKDMGIVKDHTLLCQLAEEKASAAQLLKICKLNFHNEATVCQRFIEKNLIKLSTQNQDLPVAVEAFKLYLKRTKKVTEPKESPLLALIRTEGNPNFVYLDKLERFLSALPRLGLDKNKHEKVFTEMLADQMSTVLCYCIKNYLEFTDENKKLILQVFARHKEKILPRFMAKADDIVRQQVGICLHEAGQLLERDGQKGEIEAYELGAELGNATCGISLAQVILMGKHPSKTIDFAFELYDRYMGFLPAPEQKTAMGWLVLVANEQDKSILIKSSCVLSDYYKRMLATGGSILYLELYIKQLAGHPALLESFLADILHIAQSHSVGMEREVGKYFYQAGLLIEKEDRVAAKKVYEMGVKLKNASSGTRLAQTLLSEDNPSLEDFKTAFELYDRYLSHLFESEEISTMAWLIDYSKSCAETNGFKSAKLLAYYYKTKMASRRSIDGLDYNIMQLAGQPDMLKLFFADLQPGIASMNSQHTISEFMKMLRAIYYAQLLDKDLSKMFLGLIDAVFQKNGPVILSQFELYRASVDTATEYMRAKGGYFKNKGYTQETACLNKLMTSLDSARDDFFVKKTINLETFQSKSFAAIEESRKVLGSHQGWKKILYNAGLIIITGVVGFVIAAIANKIVNNHFFFFNKNDPIKRLDALQQSICKADNALKAC